MITNLIAAFRKRRADRRRYNRAIAEIEQLNIRDLIDLDADSADLMRGAYRQIYG